MLCDSLGILPVLFAARVGGFLLFVRVVVIPIGHVDGCEIVVMIVGAIGVVGKLLLQERGRYGGVDSTGKCYYQCLLLWMLLMIIITSIFMFRWWFFLLGTGGKTSAGPNRTASLHETTMVPRAFSSPLDGMPSTREGRGGEQRLYHDRYCCFLLLHRVWNEMRGGCDRNIIRDNR